MAWAAVKQLEGVGVGATKSSNIPQSSIRSSRYSASVMLRSRNSASVMSLPASNPVALPLFSLRNLQMAPRFTGSETLRRGAERIMGKPLCSPRSEVLTARGRSEDPLFAGLGWSLIDGSSGEGFPGAVSAVSGNSNARLTSSITGGASRGEPPRTPAAENRKMTIAFLIAAQFRPRARVRCACRQP